MELQLKHLAPYLPYGLSVRIISQNITRHVKSLHHDAIMSRDYHRIHRFNDIKPILRPLSDLKVSKSLFGEYNWDYPEEFINSISGGSVEYIYMIELFKQHFDVFGLIEEGLAIDINTL